MPADRGYLLTEIHLIIANMKCLSGACSLPAGTEVVIAVSWQGYSYAECPSQRAGIPSRSFSNVVPLIQHATNSGPKDIKVLNAGLLLNIAHQNNDWGNMPPLRFVVYKVSNGADFSSPEGQLSRLDQEFINVHHATEEARRQELQAGTHEAKTGFT